MNTLRVAAVVGALAVMIGAFGAHGLKKVLEETGMRANFETGVHYHFFHALALLGVAVLARQATAPERLLQLASWCFVGGILLFSGSLYVMGLTGKRWLGAITPLGGVLFIVGWVALFLAARPAGS